MRRIILYTGIMLQAGLGTAGCTRVQSSTTTSDYYTRNDTIFVDPAGGLEQRLVLGESSTQTLSKEISTAGSIQAIPTQFAYIASPFAGRITKCFVAMGERVSAGTPLFEIISPEFTAMQKEYFQAQSEWRTAAKDYQRKQELMEGGVCSDKEYEDAMNALQQAEKEYENARAAVLTYQADPDNMTLGQPMVVRSPLNGNVIDNNIVTGMYVGDDAEPVAIVANLSKVWISAQVKEKDIRFVNEGDQVKISIAALPGEIIEGKVYHIEEMVDEDTRSIRVISICDNPDERLRIGMYATVNFFGTPRDYLTVPEKAILQNEDHSYLLAALSPGIYVKREVEVDFTSGGLAYMTSGTRPGETIICEGGYYFR